MLSNSRFVNLLFFYFSRISIFVLSSSFIFFLCFYLIFPFLFFDAFYNFEKLSIFLNYFGYSKIIEFFFKYIGFFSFWFVYAWLVHCYTGISHIFDEYLDDSVFKTYKNKIIKERHYKLNFKKKPGGIFFVFSFFYINQCLNSA